jgi:cobalt-zinc-cadmium efflux system membrane fusion protein
LAVRTAIIAVASLWLVTCLAWTATALAHEGHDHDPAPTAGTAGGRPRLAIQSEAYQVVATLDGQRLTIYLDRFEDNAPVTDAKVTVSVNGEPVGAEATPEGAYALRSGLFEGQRTVELVFDIKGSEVDDLLIGNLALPNSVSTEGSSNSAPWYEQSWSALRHGAEDHFGLLGLLAVVALSMGTMLGFGLHRRLGVRVSPALILAIISLALPSTERPALGHEGGHPDDNRVLTGPGDTARRLPNGQVFVPKPTQRILDVRTTIARQQTAPKTAVMVGRVIANPSRSGLVQSINGGRVIAPSAGLPHIGQSVARGEVLAEIERALAQSDRTTISEKSSEIEQLIAVTEAKLKRLRVLAERGVALQSLVIEAELELDGLRRRREVIRETRIEPEVLRAPIDGVIAMSRVVSGQVVQGQDVLFQIVDPASLWVEAFDYGDSDPTTLKHATAVGTANRPMKLSFQGWSRALQQQATLIQFSITDPPLSIRVGQPVTVTAEQSDTITGVIISRDAVVRGGNGEAIVWRQIEPEHFEPRPVRIEPFDATHALIAAGVAPGDHVVVRSAELINQIR